MTPPSTSRRRRYGALAAGLVALVAPLAVATPAHASSTSPEVVFTTDDDLDGVVELGGAAGNDDNDGVYGVALRDLETRRTTMLLPSDANEWIYDDPELAPFGGRVAFSTDRGTSPLNEGIAVVDRDGRNFRRLTEPPQTETTYSLDVAPAWSPDAQTIVFTRITSDRTPDAVVRTALFTVNTSGTPVVTALTQAADGYTADYSPDGRRIVFAALAPGEDSGPLQVINADGSGTRTALGPTGLMPAWSPDGQTIAYSTVTERDADRARAEDTAQIATVPATGGTGKVFASTRPDRARPSVAEYPAWLPDGESLVFDLFGYSDTDAFPPGDLWAVDREGVRAGRLLSTPFDEAQAHAQGPAPSPVAPGAASTYVPVTPKRVLDTRPAPNNVGPRVGKLGPGQTVDLVVHNLQTASGTVPPSATAVVLNVTVTGATTTTDARVYPAGGTPSTSNVNVSAGQDTPNLVTVTVGNGGAVTLRNNSGEAHLIADIAGYYVPAGTAGSVGFTAVDPNRILDTDAAIGAQKAPVPAGGFVDLRVRGEVRGVNGVTSVPADATAVVLNVTAFRATAGTNIRVYPRPEDASFPTVSNLNVRPAQAVANLVTVAVGKDGDVRLRNAAGSVHLIADIAGYYSPGSTGRFVPVAPKRFLDTRSGTGAAPIPVTATGYVDLKIAGARQVPAEARAAVFNLTGTAVSASTFVAAGPAGSPLPNVSNLNLGAGSTRANLAIVKTGSDGRVRIGNAAGQLHLIGDLAGYMVG